jgi:tetratricopeptide (TPR) repeat protein
MRYFILIAVACGLAGCSQSHVTAAQSNSRGAEYFERFQRAEELAKKEQFAEAAAVYEQLTKSYADDVEIWVKLANARSRSKQFAGAAEAFSQALARGGEYPGSLAYRIARMHGLAGDKKQAFAWLEKSLAVPMENRPRIADDEAFAAWRKDAALRKLAGLGDETSLNHEQRWNADLDFLIAEIRRMHYAYRTGSLSVSPLPAGFDEDVRRLRARLSQLSDVAMVPEIQRLLARLGDGHTGVQAIPPREFPIGMYAFADGIFVTDAPAECACIGERVVALGGMPIEAAVEKITPFLSVDNAMGVKLKAPMYLRFPEYLRATGIVMSDELVVSLNGPRGEHRFTTKASGEFGMGPRLFPSKLASARPVPRYMQRMNENYSVEALGSDAVYFQFNQVMNEQGNTIEQFAAKLRAALASSKIRNLIVDMRHNGGGNLNLFTPLLRAVITFETTHEGSAVYVLTSRQTFSAAQVFINELDRFTGAIFVGEPAGSRPNFIGESAATRLPHSGLDMTISTRYHMTDDQDQRTWIAPKIPVELTSADYFANRDPVLDTVLEVIRGRTR